MHTARYFAIYHGKKSESRTQIARPDLQSKNKKNAAIN